MNDHDETEGKHNLNRDDMRQLFDEYLPKPSHIADKPRFFISYARDDGEAYAKDLRARLIPIFGEKAIWRDREGIIANNEAGWWKQITEALDNVEYMLLIASPKAMQSEVVRKEIRYARSKGVTVCPILLPDKSQYPDFDNLPVGISQKHFYDLTHQWETLIKQLQTHGIGTKTPFSAPDMPKNFVQRPDIFNALKGYLLAQSEADATKNPVTISTALKGAGGFGKTVMATALAHDEAIQTAYLDGIVWVELGETPDMLFAMNTLYNQISPKAGSFSDMTTATKAVKDLMTGKNILLIVDDVWKAYHMQPFLESNPTGATLVTTRYVDVVIAAHADLHRVDVDEMKPVEAVQLLMSNIAHQATPTVTALAERLGNWALMMTLANAMLRKRLQRQGATFADAVAWVNDELDEEGIISITSEQVAEVRHQSAGKAIEISFRTVDEDKRHDVRTRYLQLGIFPEGASIPISALYRLWGCREHRAEKHAEQLDDLSLVKYNVATQTVTLHDVVWKYAKEVLGDDARANHQCLIEGYGDLHTLPDEYAWRNIGYHLMGANQPKQLRGLLLTYGWLDKKLHATDTNALLGDCALLLKQGKDEPIRLIQSAMSMSAHVLDKDKKALAHQLAGRLMHHYTKVDEIRTFLDVVMTTPNNLFPLNPASEYDIMNPAGGMLLRTLKHDDSVRGAIQLADGRLLSWSRDNTLRLWDSDGTRIAILTGHTTWVDGAVQLADGRILSWSKDSTLRLWDADGTPTATLTGHTREVNGAVELRDGRILSWSRDNTLRLWDANGTPIAMLTGHTDKVNGALELEDGRILSWNDDRILYLWSADGAHITTLIGHRYKVNGALKLNNKCILSWSDDKTLRLWSADGTHIATLTGHTDPVLGAIELSSGQIMSWSGNPYRSSADNSLRLWQSDGTPITTLIGHTDWVNGVIELHNGWLLSWSQDNTLRLWQSDGTLIAPLMGHTSYVWSAIELCDGDILSWGEDNTLRLWQSDGTFIAPLMGHTDSVFGAIELRNGGILSWSNDKTLRLWQPDSMPVPTLIKHLDRVWGVTKLRDGRIVSWSRDKTLHGWQPNGMSIGVIERDYYGDRPFNHTWAEKHGFNVDELRIQSTRIGRWQVDVHDNTLQVIESHTGALTHTFYGDASLQCITAFDDVVVVGDTIGRVIFLRWVGEDGASNE